MHRPGTPPPARAPGLVDSMFAAGRDLRRATRRRLDAAPRAGQTYGWLLLAGLLIFGSDLVARVVLTRAAGRLPGEAELTGWVSTVALGSLVFLPAAIGLLAPVAWAGLRFLAGGAGSCRQTFIALAWATLLTAPAIALAALLRAALPRLGLPAEGSAVLLLDALTLLLLLWIGCRCLAEAHGLPSGRKLFLVLAAAVATLGGLVAVAQPVAVRATG